MRPLRLLAAFLILFATLPTYATAQAGTEDELAADDGSGDVIFGPQTPQPGFPPGMPSSVVTDYVDLTAMRVFDESIDGIRIAVELKSLSKPPMTFSTQTVSVFFGAASSPPVSYTLDWNQEFFTGGPTDPNTTHPMFPTFCFHPAPEQEGSCLLQRVIGWTDYENRQLIAYIPKSSLQGIDPLQPESESPVPVSMPSGTRLGNFTVESQGDFWTDRLPDTGEVGPYVLKEATANQRLRVRLFTNETADPAEFDPYAAQYYPYLRQPSDFPEVSIEPGAPFPVPLEIQNRNGAKRLVNITYEFTEPKDAAKWQLRVAPSLQVPGNETRVVNLVVNASNAVEHRDTTTIRVLARSVGFPDEVGSQTLKLVATVPPGPTRPTLFLHAERQETESTIELCDMPFVSGCTGRAYLNTVETDELATGDETPVNNGGGSIFSGIDPGGRAYSHFSLEQPLPRDLVLDVNKPIVGQLRIGSSQSFEGSLEIHVRADDVYMGGTTVPVAPNDLQNPIPFTFLPLIDAERLLTASTITLEVNIDYSYVGASAALIADFPGVIPKDSFVTLPLIPDPNADNRTIGNDSGLISINVRGDRDDFVNPGESRAFNVTLVNEGADTENINITGVIESGKCAIQIKPGQRFRLDAGDSANLGILIRAHSEAKEGDRCKARIQALSEENPAAFDSILLEAVVTSGIDLEDDTENYTADADSTSKLARDDPSGTPGAGFAASLVAALGVLLWRRRANRA